VEIERVSVVERSNRLFVDVQVVTEPATQFYAIYTMPTTTPRPRLILKRRSDTEDYELLARAWQAANDKARELGWIA
jgi:hypothetical protein